MDPKRLVLALVLCFGVLFLWYQIFPPPKPAPRPEANATAQATPAGAPTGEVDIPGAVEEEQVPEFLVDEGSLVTVDTPLYRAMFNKSGVLVHFELAKYKETNKKDSPPMDLVSKTALAKVPMGFYLDNKATWQNYTWSVKGGSLDLRRGEKIRTLSFVGEKDGVTITREYTFNADTYLIEETATVNNGGGQEINGVFGFSMAGAELSSPDNRYNITTIGALNDKEFDKEKDAKDFAEWSRTMQPGLKWAGVQSNYFLLALAPDGEVGFRAGLDDKTFRVYMSKDLGAMQSGSTQTAKCAYFMGPKDKQSLEDAGHDLVEAINLGYFDIIAKPLLFLVKFFYKYVGNYGVAIIILTILIKLLFWPLSQKSYRSMNAMKKLQPHIAKLREKYKGDRQRMNQEMMTLYKTYKVNPMGGCLPMLVQIPVFIGLYQALLYGLELRHAPFISHVPFTDITWLADLSAKDPFYVTPIIMGLTMFLQQRLTPATGDPTQAKIMMFLPIVFTFIFLNFPSGLVVYWLVNNVLSIAQQWWMLKSSNKPKAAKN